MPRSPGVEAESAKRSRHRRGASVPLEGGKLPAISLTSVDLPAPLSPISPSTSPRATDSRRSPVRGSRRNCLEIPRNSSTSSGMLSPACRRPGSRTGRMRPPRSRSTPTTICWTKDETLSSTRPLVRTPISRTPTKVPPILPTPPNRLVPPITTAAITVSSRPMPATASAEFSRAERRKAASPQMKPMIT